MLFSRLSTTVQSDLEIQLLYINTGAFSCWCSTLIFGVNISHMTKTNEYQASILITWSILMMIMSVKWHEKALYGKVKLRLWYFSLNPHTGNSTLTPNADWWKADYGNKIYPHRLFFINHISSQSSLDIVYQLRHWASASLM